MEVVLHIPNKEYASELMAEGLYYFLRDRVDKYVDENNLSLKEKANIYEYLIREIEKDIDRLL